MWTSVAAVAAALLAPAAEGGALSLANVRSTYGVLGPTRADDKVLPGDSYYVSFDVEGITIADDGRVHYSIGVEASNADGKVIYKQDPRDVEVPASLGGKRISAYSRLDVGLQTPAGAYTLKVTVNDRAAKTSTTLTRKVEVLPKDFGIVRLSMSYDPEGLLHSAVFGAGDSAWLQLGAVGFGKAGDARMPAVAFTLRILDENGKPTQPKPMVAPAVKDLPAGAALVPAQFLLSLNRAGKFTVEVTATDTAGKKATLAVPLTVVEPK